MAKKASNPQGRQKHLSLWPLKPKEALKAALTTPPPGRETRRKRASLQEGERE